METKKWTSKDFLRAAKKHYCACSYLLQQFPNIKSHEEPHIVAVFFYLSGYILECLLKYSIMEQNHKKSSYTKEELEHFGLKTHELKRLWRIACDSKAVNEKKFPKWHDVTNKWDVQIRYDTECVDYKNKMLISNHFSSIVKPIYLDIIQKY